MIPLRAIAVSSLCVLLCLIAGCSSTSKESSIVGDVGGDDVAETSTEDLTMPYTLTVFDNTRINSHGDQENFQNAFADVDLINGPFSNVTLTIDLETTCFPFEEWTAPPSGERWPADCDAFDRNFEFILDGAVIALQMPRQLLRLRARHVRLLPLLRLMGSEKVGTAPTRVIRGSQAV